jgi:signal transduction histidine kinase
VPLPRLIKTSSFRLTLLYAGLFGLSVLILFAVIYLSTAGYMARQLDDAVTSDLVELQNEADGGELPALTAVVAQWARRAPAGVYYLLEDSDGRVLAGNLAMLRPVLGVFEHPKGPDKEGTEETHPLRGRGLRVGRGGTLIAARDSFQLEEMQELIARAFLWSLLTTLVLAVLGGAAMSAGLLRRVEAIGRTSREIVGGNLAQRIPVRGVDDEFDHLALSLNAMLDRIQTLMEGLKQVSNDIAHDLRTPLSRLRQRLEVARLKARTAEELRAALDGSIDHVDAILETFGALLRIAQIESGTRKAGFVRVDLSELLSAMVEIYQPVAEEKGQSIAGAIAPGLAVRGDRELLTQMFANLVENAIRHSPEGAEIAISAARRDGAIEMIVCDTGPGIPEALRSKVFRRFFRLEESRTTAGSGLGLSLVAAVATLHDIEIALGDNHPGLRVLLRFGRAPSDDQGVIGSR